MDDPFRLLVLGRYTYAIKIEIVNSFVPNAPFLYPVKIVRFFWCFQEVEKGCIRSKQVNGKTCIFKKYGKYLLVRR